MLETMKFYYKSRATVSLRIIGTKPGIYPQCISTLTSRYNLVKLIFTKRYGPNTPKIQHHIHLVQVEKI